MRRWLYWTLLLSLAVPATAVAQEDDEEDLESLDGDDGGGASDEEGAKDEKDEEVTKFSSDRDVASDDAVNQKDDLDGPFIDTGRFFADAPETAASLKKTHFSGSLTSSSMYFREVGVELPEPMGASDTGPGATSIERMFTDLRVQLHAQHISGSGWDFKADTRGRYDPRSCDVTDDTLGTVNPCLRTQSGTFGGQELEVRQLFLARNSKSLELTFGRQYVLDLAAHRLDGLALRYKKSPHVSYLAFAGLHPQKASRDLRQDYPDSVAQTDGSTKRIMPVTGGAGLAYRYKTLYGALGGVAVAPLVEDSATLGGDGKLEQPRVFLTSNGYYRQSSTIDLYHYAVLDVAGAAALEITNLTLGLNYRPNPTLRAYLQVNRVDTESLTALVQTKLDTPNADGDPANLDAIQNNIEVLRIAQDSVRAGISGSFAQRRYEASTSVALRRRDQVTLTSPGGENSFTLEPAQDLEAIVRLVDRRSLKGFRIGAQVSKSFPVGNATFQRSTTLVGRLDASRGYAHDKAELELHALAVQSDTESGAGDMSVCLLNSTPEQLEDCFSRTSARTLSVGAVTFYRLSQKVMAVASGSVGMQTIDTDVLDQGTIYPVNLFLRLAYRF